MQQTQAPIRASTPQASSLRLVRAAHGDGLKAACAHCELPLGRRSVAASVEGRRERFCCYGCVLAQQITRARGEHGAASAIFVRLGLAVFLAMNVMMLSVPTYAPHVYGGEVPSDGSLFQVLRVLALFFSAPVLLLLGGPILASAVRGARGGSTNTDVLIVVGVGAAFALSVYNTLAGRGDVYFDTASTLLVLVTAGRYLEARAKAEASAAVRTTFAPVPETVEVLRGGATARVAPAELRPGDVVRVAPGAPFPTDGVVIDGGGSADESSLSGESRPVAKEAGSEVAGGTCSIDGLFLVRVTARAADSAAARIAAMLDEARRQRAGAERLADRAASILAPLVAAIALLAAAYWSARVGPSEGILVALAVLVVACPCGLGLATPVAVWTALATAARRGVVVRSAAAFERLASVKQVFLDKTGTLTEPIPRLAAIERFPGVTLGDDELLARAAALEAHLSHPLARRLVAAWSAGSRGAPPGASNVRIVPGSGVRGVVDGEPTSIGSARFARQNLGVQALAEPVPAPDATTVWLCDRDRPLCVFRFAESARPEAAAAVSALRRLGLAVGLLSGDTAAAALVPKVIEAGEAHLGLLPEEKIAHVRAAALPTLMVGDGINDAPALAAATVGVAVGSATDLSRMTADVAVLSDDLSRIPWLVAHARRGARVIRQNLLWVVAYNFIAVGAAAAGRLNPLLASLAMLGSSVFVVANARRLRSSPRKSARRVVSC
jgi:Cu2+-exporting ATPase